MGRRWQGVGVAWRGRGGSAGSCASVCRDRSAGSCVPHWGNVAGQRWQGVGVAGVACRVGVAWWWVGSRGLACRVGVARWVGGVLGQGRMEVEWPAMSRVLRAVLGWRGGLAVAVCWGGDKMEVACVHEGAAMACNVQGLACRVGTAWWVGGGGVLQAMSERRVGVGTNGGGSHAQGGGNGLQCSG
ncbi:hypothetical protein EDB89DRAFT_1911242 [Lactarius sanguifluus]|nr:hypothetical protein EDB89DRAFT_1911242 [Lactarius sanguifluus]